MNFIYNLFVTPQSYHILKNFGGKDATYLWWWPVSGFNIFCTDEEIARAEFKKVCDDDPNGGYKLVRYPVVTRWGTVVGITGEEEVLEVKTKI